MWKEKEVFQERSFSKKKFPKAFVNINYYFLQKRSMKTLEQAYYKEILNRVLSILLQEINNVDLTEADLCKAHVSPEN